MARNRCERMVPCPRTGAWLTQAEYREVIKEIKLEKVAKEEAERLAKENRQAWRQLKIYTPDALDQAIQYWKEHKDHEDFAINAMPHIKILNKTLAVKYLVKIPRRYRRMMMDNIETFDHTEWLTPLLMECINTWDASLLRNFRVYYEERVKWFYCDKIKHLNRDYMEDKDLTFMNFNEEDETMIAKAMKHYEINAKGQIFMDLHIEEFLGTLSENERSFYTNLLQNHRSDNMTQEQLAKHLGYSPSKFKRKLYSLRDIWNRFNKETD